MNCSEKTNDVNSLLKKKRNKIDERLNLNCKFKLKQNRIHKKPKAPHNTTTFLINNRKILDNAIELDDICVTGGTMKGILSIYNTLDIYCDSTDEGSTIEYDEKLFQ